MLARLRESYKKQKWLFIAGSFFLGLVSLFGISSVFEVMAVIISYFTFAVSTQDKEHPYSKILAGYSLLLSVVFYIFGGTSLAFIPILAAIVSFLYCLEPSDFLLRVLFSTGTYTVLSLYSSPDQIMTLLLFFFVFSLVSLMSSFIRQKPAMIVTSGLVSVYKLVGINLFTARFSFIRLSDILSFKTFAEVASKYPPRWDEVTVIVIVLAVLFLIPFLIIRYGDKSKAISRRLVSLLSFLVLLFIIGVYSNFLSKIDHKRAIPDYESLPKSIIDEITFYKTPALFEEDAVDHSANAKGASMPVNIVLVLDEAFADVAAVENISLSRDPLASLRSISLPGMKEGYVSVNVFGGGTSGSEWESLTGLSLNALPDGTVPFLGKMDKNYTYFSDDIYSDCKKTVIHPFWARGWNRDRVYSVLGFDKIFLDNWGAIGADDTLRGYVKDEVLLGRVEALILSEKNPQVIQVITMQNHGAYADEPEISDRITVLNNTGDSARHQENYFTVLENSANAICDFVCWLSDHRECPTLLIVYGDHWPGDLGLNECTSMYDTPYLVYSNFGELGEIPDQLPLSSLLPFAKKAAGLPLTFWEKYIISLYPGVPDKETTAAMIKYGTNKADDLKALGYFDKVD